jgi:hypothetical protein
MTYVLFFLRNHDLRSYEIEQLTSIDSTNILISLL